MMEIRDLLEWYFKQLDYVMGFSFKVNFNFVFVGYLLKGGLRIKYEMNEKKFKVFFWIELKEYFFCLKVYVILLFQVLDIRYR